MKRLFRRKKRVQIENVSRHCPEAEPARAPDLLSEIARALGRLSNREWR